MSSEATASAWTAKRLLQWVALGLALAASVYLLVVPVYEGAVSDESGATLRTSETLLSVNGPWALVVLAVPPAIAALPLFARGRAWQPLSVVACVLLGAGVLVGILTIGVFFLPALVVEVVAACLPTRRGPLAPSREALAP